MPESDAAECYCDVLPHEDRDQCPAHGIAAQEAKAQEVQAARRVSVGRTQPLYDVSSGSSTLDRIEDIVNRAIMEGEFTVQQRNILHWALRKCRSIMEECADFGELL
jgi:hypothetical protein